MNNEIYSVKPYFSVAYNHDSTCIEEYAKLGVSEIWAGVYIPGKSNFGSGRFYRLSRDKVVDYDDLGKDFKMAKELGLKTSFLLNPGCSGNMEFTGTGIKEIKEIALFCQKYDVDYITLAQPFLAKAFKKLSPGTKIKLSSHYNINSLGKMKFILDDMGVDMVIVSQFANKNFTLLKKAVSLWNPDRFEVMCTVACMAGCPIRNWHAQFSGHSGDVEDKEYLPVFMPCLSEIHHSKTIAISCMFVRREDVKYYQKIGINRFKIGERRDYTINNINTAKYFLNKSDDFNPFFIKSKVLNNMNLKAMDGFYEKFFNEECDGTKYNCRDCSYCREYAEKVFTHTEKDIEETKIPKGKDYFDNVLLKKWLDEFDKL